VSISRIVGRSIAGALFLLVVLTGLGLLGAWAKMTWDNRAHASRVFAQVPYDHVIASHRWHPLGGGHPFDCTYAIVALLPDAQATPPDLPRRSFPLDWGGTWEATPVSLDRLPGNGETGQRHICERQLSSDTWDRIEAALTTPGSWVSCDYETLSLYSAPQGLAMRFRYGD